MSQYFFAVKMFIQFYKSDANFIVFFENSINHNAYRHFIKNFLDWFYHSVFHATEINTFLCQFHHSCCELLSDRSLLKIISSKLNAAILSLCHLQFIFFSVVVLFWYFSEVAAICTGPSSCLWQRKNVPESCGQGLYWVLQRVDTWVQASCGITQKTLRPYQGAELVKVDSNPRYREPWITYNQMH